MIDLGEQVYFGKYTDENDARRMLKEAAKKRCHGIDESRIKLIIKKDRGYITGAWHVQVKEKEYIRMLEAQNAELLKALAYDREQYQKGYADGREAGREWISVEDRLPEAKLAVLAYGRRHIRKTETTELPAPHVAYTRGEDEGWFTWDYGDYVYVSHWMPLPEPPKET